MITFETNKTYKMRFIGDSNLTPLFRVVKRTPSFLTVEDVKTGETYRAKIKNHDGEEYVLPYGSYSMAPSIKASRLVK